MIFYFEGDQAYFDLLYNENGQIQTQSISGLWSLDYDHLTLIDDETDMSYELGWDLSEEGDSYCFELTEDDTTYYLYESAAEDVDSTLNILTSYLTAEDSVDVESDDIDLSDFLAGYVGHSVIDAFMLSGISPDFETRKYCAELLGFTNYSGTSDENLALIQLMGRRQYSKNNKPEKTVFCKLFLRILKLHLIVLSIIMKLDKNQTFYKK